MMRRMVFSRAAALAFFALVACSRAPSPRADAVPSTPPAAAPAPSAGAPSAGTASAAPAGEPPLPAGAKPCAAARADGGAVVTCVRFASAEDAFRWVLAHDPEILAVGEAHAQKGTEAIASTTKRFTDALLPIVAPRASDVVVELWAPDPSCRKEVKAVASAQKPVTSAQASTNQNEYLTLGTRAKALGMTPWLLRPTCDDFAMLADAGADDAVGKMLALVERLTEDKLTKLWQRNRASASGAPPKMVLAYGGAVHNDLAPSAETKDWSFGPPLAARTSGRYVELDLIVPEYVKDTPTWRKLPWYAAHAADPGPKDEATLYAQGDRSFTIVLPSSR